MRPSTTSFNTDRKLQALQSLCQVLAKFNQKKSIIYFSSGMTQTGLENQSALRAAVNTAIKANVAIYTMDSRGLESRATRRFRHHGKPARHGHVQRGRGTEPA